MANLVVDTSVWIDFFRGRLSPGMLDLLGEGIRQRTIALTDVIRHEILVGARSEQDFNFLKHHLVPFECLRILEHDLESFDRFAWRLHRKGLTGKYTDLSIAFLCQIYDLPIMTFDGYFGRLSGQGIIRSLSSWGGR